MRQSILAACACLLIGGCTTSIDPGPVNGYPIAKNSVWNYRALASLTNFHPLQTGAAFRDTTITWFSQARAEGADTLLDSIYTWKFTTVDTGAVTSSGVQHYIVNGDTLFLFAYFNPSLALPKRRESYSLTFGGKQYTSPDALLRSVAAEFNVVETLYVEVSPPPVLIFPLTVGNEWEYRHAPFLIHKKVIGTENVSTPAGDIACYKIQWLWDINADGKPDSLLSGFDYVNTKGLIKRVFELKHVLVSLTGIPDPIGDVNLRNEFLVTSFEGALYPASKSRY